MKIDLLITNASQLATPDPTATDGPNPTLVTIQNGAVAVSGENIVAVGKTKDVLNRMTIQESTRTIDASNKTILPGFVDCHTHPVFSATREQEFALRIQGKTYQEIARAGGGIRSSVRDLRNVSKEKLIQTVLPRLDRFLELGTTTIEAKSGYGLSLKDEIKSLEVIRELNDLHPIDLIPTFLGAHEVPDEYRNQRDVYIDIIVKEMIPRVAQDNLALFCDVFCEEGVFSIAEARRILTAAKDADLIPKIHADQLSPSGGAQLAAEVGAVSAEHLEFISHEGIRALAEKNITAVLLPGASFFLRMEKDPPAKEMMEQRVPLALATDFNPGSCPCPSMPLMITLAGLRLGLLPETSLVAATWGGAKAIATETTRGTLRAGARADLVVWNTPNFQQIPYYFGVNLVDSVVKNGSIVFQREPTRFSSVSTKYHPHPKNKLQENQ